MSNRINPVKSAGLLALGLFCVASTAGAQVYGTFASVNGPTAQWVLLGTLTLPEQGYNGLIRMYAGNGYNASNAQNGYVDLFIRTSNTLSASPAGFCASAFASRYGEAGAGFVQAVTLVSNQAGCQSGNSTPPQYSVYVFLGQFVGSGFYSVEASSLGQSGGSAWAAGGTVANPTGCGAGVSNCTNSSSTYIVPFEQYHDDTAIFDSYVGIKTTATPVAPLDLGSSGGVKEAIFSGNGGYFNGLGVNLGQAPNALSLFIGPPTGDGSDGPPSFEVVSANSMWPYTGYTTRLAVLSSTGAVGIGTVSPCTNSTAPTNCLLAVKGAIEANEVVVSTGWSDYVFAPNYKLAPLSEVSEYVKANHHLPDIPSAAEVSEKGVNLGDMQAKLLAKIEELTLHMIQAEKENRDLRAENLSIQRRLAELEAKMEGAGK